MASCEALFCCMHRHAGGRSGIEASLTRDRRQYRLARSKRNPDNLIRVTACGTSLSIAQTKLSICFRKCNNVHHAKLGGAYQPEQTLIGNLRWNAKLFIAICPRTDKDARLGHKTVKLITWGHILNQSAKKGLADIWACRQLGGYCGEEAVLT